MASIYRTHDILNRSLVESHQCNIVVRRFTYQSTPNTFHVSPVDDNDATSTAICTVPVASVRCYSHTWLRSYMAEFDQLRHCSPSLVQYSCSMAILQHVYNLSGSTLSLLAYHYPMKFAAELNGRDKYTGRTKRCDNKLTPVQCKQQLTYYCMFIYDTILFN